MKKQKEFKPEYGIEYTFRFYNQRLKKPTQWVFIYDETLPDGKYAFFKRPGGGRTPLSPERFNHIMTHNLISKKQIEIPKKIDYKLKRLEEERQRKEAEARREKEKSDAWGRDVLGKFNNVNAFQRATVEKELSISYDRFLKDVKRFIGDEELSCDFVNETFKKINRAASVLNFRLTAL